ncbi:hypothetical protein BC831DRAFT_513490 [Entophlyctis helioformis]|nr:hypothetical protein BC831DRAFT_513490 [Entophlyctis helioformis]
MSSQIHSINANSSANASAATHADNDGDKAASDSAARLRKLLLPSDIKVLVSGCDIDGIPRGKTISIDKLVKSVKDNGFGFCSVVFGWDLHDTLYNPKPPLLAGDAGFADVIARIDTTCPPRRLPWSSNIPLFMVDFCDPRTGAPLPMCPRSLLKRVVGEAAALGIKVLSGVEYEWFNFRETPETLHAKQGVGLAPLTTGMFGYSLQRPHVNKELFRDIYDHCHALGVPLEGLHTETGPGVFEAAIAYTDALQLADRAHLFKMAVKQISLDYGVISCFMAKPYGDQPGCSGHMHFSLADIESMANLFAPGDTHSVNAAASSPVAESPDTGYAGSVDGASPVEQTKASGSGMMYGMTPAMQWFVAGVLAGLPSIMAILAPNINSYKRLVENFWAPLTVSYGIENRTTAIRVILPPTCSASASRIEVRVPGADSNPYLVAAAIIGCGMHGLKTRLALPFPPASTDAASPPSAGAKHDEPLPRSLQEATARMMAPDSMARRVLGDGFVDHYGATRIHECRLWSTAVTNWELKRYMETA